MSIYQKSTELITILTIILAGIITIALFKEVNGATFLNLDEVLWMRRADTFKDHLLNGNFSGLIQSSQPGIMAMWLAGPMMHLVDFFDFDVISRMIAYKETQGLDFNFVANVNDPVIYSYFREISFLFNIPFLLITFSGFLIFYSLLKKLGFNKNIALIALTFIATTPWYVYFTTPSDKGLMIFMTLSLLFLMVYGNEIRRDEALPRLYKSKKFLIISAVLAAWAVLSKLTALFFVFLVPFILIFYAWPLSKTKIRLLFKDCLIWITIFFIISAIFLPTIIFNPQEVIDFLIHPAPMILEDSYQPSSYLSRIWEYFREFVLVIPGYMSPAPAIFFGIFVVICLMLSSKKILCHSVPDTKSRSKRFANHLYKIFQKINRAIFRKLYCKFNVQSILSWIPAFAGMTKKKIKKHLTVLIIYLMFFTLMTILLSNNHDIRFLAPVFIVMDIFAAVAVYWLIEILRKKFHLEESIYTLVIFLLIMAQMVYIVGNGGVFNNS